MNALIVVWSYTLCVINIVSGLIIIQHAICNLSRWTYSIRSVALWWNALLLGGGIHIVTAYAGGKTPVFGEVLINLGIALMGIRSMRRIYREYAEDPAGLLAHAKTELVRVLGLLKALFTRSGNG